MKGHAQDKYPKQLTTVTLTMPVKRKDTYTVTHNIRDKERDTVREA